MTGFWMVSYPWCFRNPPFFFDNHISIIYRVSSKNKCLYIYIIISMGPRSNQSKKNIPFIDGPRWTSWPSLQALISQVANRTKNARQRYGNSVNPHQPPFGCKNPVNNGVAYLLPGAGFLPSTVSKLFPWRIWTCKGNHTHIGKYVRITM